MGGVGSGIFDLYLYGFFEIKRGVLKGCHFQNTHRFFTGFFFGLSVIIFSVLLLFLFCSLFVCFFFILLFFLFFFLEGKRLSWGGFQETKIIHGDFFCAKRRLGGDPLVSDRSVINLSFFETNPSLKHGEPKGSLPKYDGEFTVGKSIVFVLFFLKICSS